MKIETILVPTDFSKTSEKAFVAALGFARAFGARIDLLHAYDFGQWVSFDEAIFAEKIAAEIREAARRRLDAWVERAGAAGIDATLHLEFGPPGRRIIEHARERGVDLIVIGSRGHGAVKHVLLGSVAERTLHEAPCPVLVIPADLMTDDVEAE